MMDKSTEFLNTARQVLDDSVQDLDGATLSRLAQARNAALNSKRQTRRKALIWGAPAAGMAAAVLLLLILLPGKTPVAEEHFVADLDLLGSEETLDFYEEMEFYEWLAEMEASSEDDISHRGGGDDIRVSAAGDDGTGYRRFAERGAAGISRRFRG